MAPLPGGLQLLPANELPPPRATGADKYACVDATIDEQGKVQDPQLVGTSDEEFGRECVSVMRKWQFQPLVLEGRPITVRTRLACRFVHH